MWEEDNKWEQDWWGTCQNTFGEEMKQLLYADRMGLKTYHDGKGPFNIRAKGKILDIGGGPCSMLLKCSDVKGTIIDPCVFPKWVIDRYKLAEIEFIDEKAEYLAEQDMFDEVWIYNVLQHTDNPERIIEAARKASKIIRIFEWIDTGTSKGHPHELKEKELNKWLGGEGKTEELKGQNTCWGKCYYGVFKGGV